MQFEIEVDDSLKGTHCSVFYNGKFIDCSNKAPSISLVKTGTNTFEGTIRSEYSATTGKIKMVLTSSKKTLHFRITEEPSGVFYIPEDIILTRL